MQREKPNLVIVHSFPTNSIILKGFYDFMSDYFKVYPIDLPGFVKGIKPLKKISINNYAKFVEKEIEKMGLKNYWVSGVSFGFAVVNRLKDRHDCKGIIAIEPYLGAENLNIPFHKKIFYLALIKSLEVGKGFYRVWHSTLFQKEMLRGSSVRFAEKIKKLLDEIDARTFFVTARLLLQNHDTDCSFLNKPYVLVINNNDESIRAEKVISKFACEVKDLLIVHTAVEHYPKNITKEYFKKRIEVGEVNRILDFVNEYSKK